MTKVALFRGDELAYPQEAPFHPPEVFPELVRAGINEIDASNGIYSAVRNALALLGLDRENFRTAAWNPLGAFVRRGGKVVIKPNFVLHEFGAQKGAHCLTTHGSVIRAVLDYVYLAAGPEGAIVIADAPLQGADFESVLLASGLREVRKYYRENLNYELNVIDLRRVRAFIDEKSSFIRGVMQLPGDPLGYNDIDLSRQSCLASLDEARPRYVVGDYDANVTNARHGRARHEYVVSRTVLEADSVICVPKLKTHSKAGVTVCLKNLVGIIGSKDCLPHHRHGRTDQGGDEFPSDYPSRWFYSARAYATLQGRVPQTVWRTMRSLAQAVLGAGTPINGDSTNSSSGFFLGGGWHGNDTIWRVVDDLNRLLYFYDSSIQRLSDGQQRRYFAVVDGIVAMEGNGPLRGTPRPCGLILAGEDALAVDVVAATLMGLNWRQIRMLAGIAASEKGPRYSKFSGDESSLDVLSNYAKWDCLEEIRRNHLNFQPPAGWRGHVEGQCGASKSMTDCPSSCKM